MADYALVEGKLAPVIQEFLHPKVVKNTVCRKKTTVRRNAVSFCVIVVYSVKVTKITILQKEEACEE